MTDSIHAARSDLAFMKSVVEDRGPLPWFLGAHLFAVGLIFGLDLLAGATFAWRSPLWSWLPAAALYAPTWFFINSRSDYASMGPSARVFGAVWMSVCLMTLTVAAAFVIAEVDTKVAYGLIWPSVAGAFYGGAWMVGALIRRRGWMALVALGCFAISIAASALIGRPQALQVLGAGLLAVFAAPGFVLMRLSRRAR